MFCEVLLLHPWRGDAAEQELDLDDCTSSCRSCVNRRSVIILFSLVQGPHTQLGVLHVCEVLVLQDWVLIFHLAALTVKK